jgi:hypothetical protein
MGMFFPPTLLKSTDIGQPQLHFLEAIVGRSRLHYRARRNDFETVNHTQASVPRSSCSATEGGLLARPLATTRPIPRERCFSTIGSHAVQMSRLYFERPQSTADPADTLWASLRNPEWLTEKIARQRFASLVGGKSHICEDPLSFFKRALELYDNGQLQLITVFNAAVPVECIASFSHGDSQVFKGFGRDIDKVSPMYSSLLSIKVLTMSRRALRMLLLC